MDKRPTLIHIGYHKTGSTWFQKAFFPSFENLYVVPQNLSTSLFVFPSSFSFDASSTAEHLWHLTEEAECQSMVVSNEELSGNIHSGGNGGYVAKEVAERLYQTFGADSQILIFLRNQEDMIESSYRQYLKIGGTQKLHAYLNPPHESHRRPRFSLSHFEYDQLVSFYFQLFGKDHVHVFFYEDFKSDKDVVLRSIMQIMGFQSAWTGPNAAINQSHSRGALKFLRIVNFISHSSSLNDEMPLCFPIIGKIAHRWVLPMLNKWFSKHRKSFLDYELRQKIRLYYKNSNTRLTKTLSMTKESLAKRGYSVEFVEEGP